MISASSILGTPANHLSPIRPRLPNEDTPDKFSNLPSSPPLTCSLAQTKTESKELSLSLVSVLPEYPESFPDYVYAIREIDNRECDKDGEVHSKYLSVPRERMKWRVDQYEASTFRLLVSMKTGVRVQPK